MNHEPGHRDTRRLESVATDQALLVEQIGTWRPAALWAGGGRSDEPRDVALHRPAIRRRARHLVVWFVYGNLGVSNPYE
jgi:hypothetical protein